MGHAKTIARNSLWSLADSLLGMVSSFGCSIAVSRVLGPEDTGYYQYVTFTANMAGWIAAFGFPAATRTFAGMAVGKGDYGLARSIVEMTFRIQFYLALAAVLVGMVIVFATVPHHHRLFAIIAVATILPTLMFTIPSGGITATEDLAPNVRASLVSTVFVGGGTVLSLVVGWGLPGLAGAMFASKAVDFALRQIFYKRIYAGFKLPKERTPIPPEIRHEIIQFCKQATFMTALEIVVWERSEVLFLQKFSGMSEVAYFSQPFNWVSQWLLLLPRIISSAAAASIAVQHGRDPKQTVGLAIGSTRALALISLPAAFGLSALGAPIISQLLGPKFLPSIGAFSLLAVMTLGKAFTMPARQLLVSTNRQPLLIKWGLAFCVLNVALDLILIPGRGAMGAAIAKGIILTGGGVSIWWMVAKSFETRLPLAIVGRMTVASAVMFVVVRALTAVMPAKPVLVIGPLAGIATIVILYRLLRCLEPGDRDLMAALGRRLPARTRPAFTAMVNFMIPRATPSRAAPGPAA
jgi:O-antigen/teichoic acid export membrane protein